ncbi:hypothetical protein AB0G04_22200 [Actinoplanes sp. NPDC023801]|uniref:SWIM zinc finger family protein n=1 Tax=Actinoplanes sp. NPDC023801 TaxID=3154595 RepID=UPI0033E4C9B9
MTDFSPAFLGMFESLRMGPTFARGRRDERAGHVRSLTVSGSLVVALVRGPDDPEAFRARIAVRAFGASEWARVETALVAEARYVADLLDGRMPPGIEEIFAGAGLSVLPLSLDEVAMDCTCERWPKPCAHLAATCYALARAFESDPFEVFTWRGRPRDELLMRLRRLREAAAVDASGSGGAAGPDGSSGAFTDTAGSSGAAGSSGSAGSGGSGGFDDGTDPGASGRTGTGGGGRRGTGGAGPATVRHPAADPLSFWGSVPATGSEVPGVASGDSGMDSGSAEQATGVAGQARRAGTARPDVTGGLGVAGTSGGLRPDALLDQLDAPGLSHLGQPVAEVLRPAYLALPDTEDAG